MTAELSYLTSEANRRDTVRECSSHTGIHELQSNRFYNGALTTTAAATPFVPCSMEKGRVYRYKLLIIFSP